MEKMKMVEMRNRGDDGETEAVLWRWVGLRDLGIAFDGGTAWRWRFQKRGRRWSRRGNEELAKKKGCAMVERFTKWWPRDDVLVRRRLTARLCGGLLMRRRERRRLTVAVEVAATANGFTVATHGGS
ncbi:hypothetical protein LR48_Vigan312s000600 [Vigna angularis]|uniref:Uncharacterized protein n=1 Tax=Phaseolus angularis TaxID=3914 RepID=A0A0L9T812_PHAAN|nr:hypothetical protein LR48_Vigan312s000600 [Vigna angularis]